MTRTSDLTPTGSRSTRPTALLYGPRRARLLALVLAAALAAGAAGPAAAQSGAAQTDAAQTDAAQTDAAQTDAAQTDAAQSDATTATDATTVTVDLATSTGAVYGGATGMLYGLSDEGVPTDALIAGARPRTITQKAPDGLQHPNGDPLEVEREFVENGGTDIYVNVQDIYPQWGYANADVPSNTYPGIEDYLAKLRTVVQQIVASPYRDHYVLTPFNEPDWIWYGDWTTRKDQFLSDWSAAYTAIKEIWPEARIAGPGESVYHADRLRDLLTYARDHDQLPDVVTWHELDTSSLSAYRTHYADYRALEQDLGIDPLAINITEYGQRRDMSVPGQLIQWMTMFEDTKVDANLAYWTYAGNLDDQSAEVNQANGAWWLLSWYADLTGETVRVTPPHPDTVDTVQAIAALDTADKRATVLVGGTAEQIPVQLTGIDNATFGGAVDVTVRETGWSGQEGAAGAPRVISSERVAVVDGALTVTIPPGDVMSAYQVLVTPAAPALAAVDTAWRSTVEAEDTTLRDVVAYPQSTSTDPWLYATSGQADVGSTNQATSALTWQVDVPRDGTYRLGIYQGANGSAVGAGRHALFVDGALDQVVQYTADLGWTYHGRTDVLVELTAGSHELSLRTSVDGVTLLPGSDIALDRFDLTEVVGAETSTYPAATARRTDGTVDYDAGAGTGRLTLPAGSTATFLVSAAEDGYYDLSLDWGVATAGTVTLDRDGRPLAELVADRPGTWTGTVRVHLATGISQIHATVGTPAGLDQLTVQRAAGADGAAVSVEAEDSELLGAAQVHEVAATSGSNASGGAYVDWLGEGGALRLARPDGLAAGAYDLVVAFAQADKNTGHPYNTDVITRFLDVAEEGGDTVRAAFRHTYAWDSFWTRVVPVDLDTDDGALTLGNADGWGPNLDRVTWAPLVLDVAVHRVVGSQGPATAVPAAATVSDDNGWDTGLQDGTYSVRTDRWWGQNATGYRLYEDGLVVDSRSLTAATPSAQQVRTDLTGRTAGVHVYRAELVNEAGSTSTDELVARVG